MLPFIFPGWVLNKADRESLCKEKPLGSNGLEKGWKAPQGYRTPSLSQSRWPQRASVYRPFVLTWPTFPVYVTTKGLVQDQSPQNFFFPSVSSPPPFITSHLFPVSFSPGPLPHPSASFPAPLPFLLSSVPFHPLFHLSLSLNQDPPLLLVLKLQLVQTCRMLIYL